MSFDVIQQATQSPTADAFEAEVLASLNREIGFDVGVFLTNPNREPTVFGYDEGRMRRLLHARSARYGRDLEPVKRAALAARGVAVDTDVLGERMVSATSYYRDLAEPVGGRHSMVAYLRLRGRVVGGLVLGRCSSCYRDADVFAMESTLPGLAVACASFGEPTAHSDVTRLSPREREVLEYLCLGYRNREIANAFGTSPNTVRNQLACVFQKLGATTRAEAVALARHWCRPPEVLA
jgi:DNA-binding CsgD family transcriptional regulator